MGSSDTTAALEVRTRYGVPAALGLRVDEREVLAWVDGYEVSVREVAAHPDDLALSRRLGGRTRLRVVESPPGGRLLVREYVKGGLLRRVRGPLMQGRWRPLDELVLHRRLIALGAPVTEAVGCVVLRYALGWRGFLLVKEVPDSLDLEAWLYGVPGSTASPRRAVLEDAGRAVRRLHDAGVPHPDLHPKNLLVGADGSVLVLDLDKVRSSDGVLEDGERLSNLVRLGRSIEKHRLKGLTVAPSDVLRFLEGYAGSKEAARQWLERIRAQLSRGLGTRRIWWRLLGEARPWRTPSPPREEA